MIDGAASWLESHFATRDSVRYLAGVAQLLIALVAAWYVSRRVLAGFGSGAALRVPQ